MFYLSNLRSTFKEKGPLKLALSLVPHDPIKAEQIFNIAIQSDNRSGSASYYYGRFLFEQDRFNEALCQFHESEIVCGFHATTALMIAKCLYKLDRLQESRAKLTEILERNPSHGGSMKLLLEIFLEQNREP